MAGFFTSILRNTIGQGGLSGLLSSPIRTALATRQASEVATDASLTNSLAERTNMLAEALPRIKDPTQKARIQSLIRQNINNMQASSETIRAQIKKVDATIPTLREIAGQTINTALTAATFGRGGVLGAAAGTPTRAVVGQGTKTFLRTGGLRALDTGLTTAGLSAGENLQTDKSANEVLREGAVAFGVGATLSMGGSLLKGLTVKALDATLPLLSRVSGTPENVLRHHVANPERVIAAGKANPTLEGITAKTRDAVIKFRKSLSNQYGLGKDMLAQEFSGVRAGASGEIRKLFGQIDDSISKKIRMPNNTESASIKEWLDTYASVNELWSQRAVREGAEGIAVRKLRTTMRDFIVKQFGGTGGSVDLLLNNYSKQSAIMNNVDDLVRAYKDNPRAVAAAERTLRQVFNDDKGAYLQALLDFEEAAGVSILDGLAAESTKRVVPQAGAGSISKTLDFLVKMVIAPISSPRSSAAIARTLGKLSINAQENGLGPVMRLIILNMIAQSSNDLAE